MITETDLKIDTHIATCSERYLGIELQFRATNARLKKIENILWAGAVMIITGMGSIIILLLEMKK
jgi:hypothetical protein